jgi:hypothetical protein
MNSKFRDQNVPSDNTTLHYKEIKSKPVDSFMAVHLSPPLTSPACPRSELSMFAATQ